MAIQSVPTTPKIHTGLTLAQVDAIDVLHHQARAIVELIRAVSESDVQTPDDAIPGACWAVSDKITEIEQILKASRQ